MPLPATTHTLVVGLVGPECPSRRSDRRLGAAQRLLDRQQPSDYPLDIAVHGYPCWPRRWRRSPSECRHRRRAVGAAPQARAGGRRRLLDWLVPPGHVLTWRALQHSTCDLRPHVMARFTVNPRLSTAARRLRRRDHPAAARVEAGVLYVPADFESGRLKKITKHRGSPANGTVLDSVEFPNLAGRSCHPPGFTLRSQGNCYDRAICQPRACKAVPPKVRSNTLPLKDAENVAQLALFG